jgi:hypothetical protein
VEHAVPHAIDSGHRGLRFVRPAGCRSRPLIGSARVPGKHYNGLPCQCLSGLFRPASRSEIFSSTSMGKRLTMKASRLLGL